MRGGKQQLHPFRWFMSHMVKECVREKQQYAPPLYTVGAVAPVFSLVSQIRRYVTYKKYIETQTKKQKGSAPKNRGKHIVLDIFHVWYDCNCGALPMNSQRPTCNGQTHGKRGCNQYCSQQCKICQSYKMRGVYVCTGRKRHSTLPKKRANNSNQGGKGCDIPLNIYIHSNKSQNID